MSDKGTLSDGCITDSVDTKGETLTRLDARSESAVDEAQG